MKLVQILARELKEWPEDGGPVVAVVQDPDRMAYVRPHDDADEFAFRQNEWIGVWHNLATARSLSELATDHATAIVTRAQWKAEKARITGKVDGGWIRNRGRSNKSPVPQGVRCTVKFRDGSEATGEVSDLRWIHNGGSVDVMRYKTHKPAEQPAPVSEEAIQVGIDAADAGKLTPIAEVNARYTGSHAGILLGPQPLAWRDRIRTLDTQRAELEATYQRQIGEIVKERGELVERLASEGLALVEVVRPVEDMSDPANWLEGDIIEFIKTDGDTSHFTLGKHYVVADVNMRSYNPVSVKADDDGDYNGWRAEYFKWHSRPVR